MTSFEVGDVVRLPFPYTDRPIHQRRPALVVVSGPLAERHALLWVCMITSAANRGWPDDLPIADLSMAGLPVASVIRPVKIATVDAFVADRLGRVGEGELNAVMRTLARLVGALQT
jgi:mRNA interferase MazF